MLGKGDAMWRALAVLPGEIVCFLDADSEQFGAHFACGLLGPLLCEPRIAFVKGFYRRPFRVGELTLPDGGGRVTELTARPLLNLFYPDLAAVEQPLAGRDRGPARAARAAAVRHRLRGRHRAAARRLREVGLDGIAQVDLDVRQNAHQPLRDLGPMAYAVLQAVASRLEREGRLRGPLPASFLALDARGRPARGRRGRRGSARRSASFAQRPRMRSGMRSPSGVREGSSFAPGILVLRAGDPGPSRRGSWSFAPRVLVLRVPRPSLRGTDAMHFARRAATLVAVAAALGIGGCGSSSSRSTSSGGGSSTDPTVTVAGGLRAHPQEIAPGAGEVAPATAAPG